MIQRGLLVGPGGQTEWRGRTCTCRTGPKGAGHRHKEPGAWLLPLGPRPQHQGGSRFLQSPLPSWLPGKMTNPGFPGRWRWLLRHCWLPGTPSVPALGGSSCPVGNAMAINKLIMTLYPPPPAPSCRDILRAWPHVPAASPCFAPCAPGPVWASSCPSHRRAAREQGQDVRHIWAPHSDLPHMLPV